MYREKVFKIPKAVSNIAASMSVTNSRVGNTYPTNCKDGICFPEYIVDQVVQCVKCKKIKA